MSNQAILAHGPVPNMRHLRAFSLVAKLHSVSRAAQEIHLSQSAVTQAVAKLEERFASDLFVRHRRGMYCTQYGDLLQMRIDRAFAELTAALAKFDFGGKQCADCPPLDPSRAVTWTQLRAALAVMEHRNLAGAARAIGLSRPSLSRTLRELESAIGASLFAYEGSVLVPTEVGLDFTKHASLALREIELAEEDINTARGASSGRVAIGSTPAGQAVLVPRAISRLTKRHPNIRVSLIDGSYESLLYSLRAGTVDVVITATRRPPPVDDVVEERLFIDPLHVAARAGHPLHSKAGLALNDLADFPWVIPLADTPVRSHYDRLFGRAGGLRRGVLEVRSFASMRTLLLESDHLALVSRHQLVHELEGQIVILPIDLPDTQRVIGMTIRRNWHMSRAQADLLAEIRTISRELQNQSRERS